MSRPVLIGIDGGGSGTRAVIGHGPDAVLGRGEAGTSCVRDVGEDASGEELLAAVAAAWNDAGLVPHAADSIFLGLAGVATDDERTAAQRVAARIPHQAEACVAVDHDLRVAHAGALADEESPRRGVVLVAGTGAACMGVDATGAAATCGGWGPTLGDAGGGHFLGLEAMRAVVRAVDGRGPATDLVEAILAALEIDEPRRMLDFVDHGADRRRIAALAPLVVELASRGDDPARAVLARAAEELASLVAHASERVAASDGRGPVPVAAVGGLTRAGEPFVGSLRAAVERACPLARWIEPCRSPAEGALLLAHEALL